MTPPSAPDSRLRRRRRPSGRTSRPESCPGWRAGAGALGPAPVPPPGRLHLKVILLFPNVALGFSPGSCPWPPFPPALANTPVPFAPPPSCPGRHPTSAFNQPEVSLLLAAKSCSLIYLCALCVCYCSRSSVQGGGLLQPAARSRQPGVAFGARQPCRPAGALTPASVDRKVSPS